MNVEDARKKLKRNMNNEQIIYVAV
jgi:hypothetical protein